MPIITECLSCEHPLFASLEPAPYVTRDCVRCDETLVIEMSRIGGKTYKQSQFEKEILPKIDEERLEHPEKDVVIYGDPDEVTWV